MKYPIKMFCFTCLASELTPGQSNIPCQILEFNSKYNIGRILLQQYNTLGMSIEHKNWVQI
jgi:hypothetical protein